MLRTILLGGPLGKRFGEEHILDVRNPAEALRLVDANRPGFENFIRSHPTQKYQVLVGDEAIGGEALVKNTGAETIKIIPIVSGSSRGIGQIILGSVLFAASFIPGFSMLGPIGVSLMLGGVAQMISPVPSIDESYERPGHEPSYAFNGILNTINEGNAIPLLYGQADIGGQLIHVQLVVE